MRHSRALHGHLFRRVGSPGVAHVLMYTRLLYFLDWLNTGSERTNRMPKSKLPETISEPCFGRVGPMLSTILCRKPAVREAHRR